jgi:hypothetical protein
MGFCQQLFKEVADDEYRCFGGSKSTLELAFQSFPFCAGLDPAVAAGSVTFSPRSAEACLTEVMNADCDSLGADPPDCSSILEGRVPIGGPCYSTFDDCAPGGYCVTTAQCPGVCQAYGLLGSPCGTSDTSQCDPSLTCRSTTALGGATCQAPAQVGTVCASSSDCEALSLILVCIGPSGPVDYGSATVTGTCQKAPSTGPCSLASDCSTKNCVEGACMPANVVGDACTPGISQQCGPGAYCGTNGKCAADLTVGQTCDLTSGDNCALSSCDVNTNTCVALLTPGQSCEGPQAVSPCDQSSQCSPTSGICLPNCAPGACGAAGQICCAGNVCAAGLACAGATCVSGPPVTDAGLDARISTSIPITPNALGYFDGTNAPGVLGAWWASGDDFGPSNTAGAGTCPLAGFPNGDCSSIVTPTPGQPFVPDSTGRGMCTRGVGAEVLPGDGGAYAYAAIFGAT